MKKTCDRSLGKTGLMVGPIGFGAFKIGRNQKTKYPLAYELPDEAAADRLLNELLDLGVHYFDTAPAYGLSEERIGAAISKRRREFVLSTKVGETFAGGVSTYDFSRNAVHASLRRSLTRLKTEAVDVLFVHAPADDLRVLLETDVVEALRELKDQGLTRAIGFSAKTQEAALRALDWADALMVEYHRDDQAMAGVIEQAASRRVGVVVKKALASGTLPAADALRFVLANPAVSSVVVGTLNLAHMRSNVALAEQIETP